MAIPRPKARWRSIATNAGVLDFLSALVALGPAGSGAYRFWTTRDLWWFWGMVAAGVLAFCLQCVKALLAIHRQLKQESLHDLEGCLHTLEAVLLGADLAEVDKMGLRLTIWVPAGKGQLQQACNYVGNQRVSGGAGRMMPETSGAVGKAFAEAKMAPKTVLHLHQGERESENFDIFRKQMVRVYGFSTEAASALHPSTNCWVAVALSNGKHVEGVFYCDAVSTGFFNESRKEDILHAMSGIAFFVAKRYA